MVRAAADLVSAFLLMVAQHWWSSFGLANHDNWSFALFATILIQTALFYMMAAVVLPDIPSDQPTDLRDHYYREAPVLFDTGIATIGWSLFRGHMIDGELLEPIVVAFHLLFLAMALTACLSRRPRLHEFFA